MHSVLINMIGNYRSHSILKQIFHSPRTKDVVKTLWFHFITIGSWVSSLRISFLASRLWYKVKSIFKKKNSFIIQPNLVINVLRSGMECLTLREKMEQKDRFPRWGIVGWDIDDGKTRGVLFVSFVWNWNKERNRDNRKTRGKLPTNY